MLAAGNLLCCTPNREFHGAKIQRFAGNWDCVLEKQDR